MSTELRKISIAKYMSILFIGEVLLISISILKNVPTKEIAYYIIACYVIMTGISLLYIYIDKIIVFAKWKDQ